jgi:glucose/arabinose dehydrogenase
LSVLGRELILVIIVLVSSVTLLQIGYFVAANAQQEETETHFSDNDGTPDLLDPNFSVEQVVSGLDLPTTMAFLGPDDILVLEKDKGTVRRVTNGELLSAPLVDFTVGTQSERAMGGIAISHLDSKTYVFLYLTELDKSYSDGDDLRQNVDPLGNRLYRYEFVDGKLINPLLLLDLPALPGPRHNGGAIIIGPDDNLYIPVGDVDGSYQGENYETQAQNYPDGVPVDGRSGILRITQDGQPVGEHGILGDEIPLNLYYAYGIRNSFGIDFDPVTGNLWETENGPGNSDEINLVLPGFNSGWRQTMGFAQSDDDFDLSNMVDFDGKGKYRDPELVWINTAGPTGIKFLSSDIYGPQYKNDLFVGDVHNGRLYHFKLNGDRTHLILEGDLASNVIRTPRAEGIDQILLGEGFGGITDLELGPDGYLYIVSIGQGKIFRLIPS